MADSRFDRWRVFGGRIKSTKGFEGWVLAGMGVPCSYQVGAEFGGGVVVGAVVECNRDEEVLAVE